MPRPPARPRVPRINLDVVRRAYRSLPGAGESDFYILEKIDGPCLRIRRTVVQVGVRYRSRFHLAAEVRPDMTIQEVEEARDQARRLLRQLQDDAEMPSLARGRSMTVRLLYDEFMADFKKTRGEARSSRTLEGYESVWRIHLLPAIGHLRLEQITTDVVRQLKKSIPAQVLGRRPLAKGGGKPIANQALHQLEAALGFAYRMEWVTRNVASARLVPRYEVSRSEEFLDAAGYAAVGEVIRDLESLSYRGLPAPLSLRTLFALRLAIYTGARHRSELLWTLYDWCHLDDKVPRIGIPRAKGDRRKGSGRWIYLGPEAVRLLKAIPRPAGSEHLTVPGDRPGRPLFRLNEAWRLVLLTAGLPEIPVKALRHGFSTHSAGIIAPEHRAQLLGHQGRPMTDTVYLHQHGPDLARAATLVEAHLRVLLGDLEEPAMGRVLPFEASSRSAF
jgi:integrase